MSSSQKQFQDFLEEDASPGRHDTLMAPRDNELYGCLGCTEYHDNCRDNMRAALLEMVVPFTPASLNLFVNIPGRQDGALSFEPALSKPSDAMLLPAQQDCIAAMLCCPQDILAINSQQPREAHFEALH